jgi:hypothetical protein
VATPCTICSNAWANSLPLPMTLQFTMTQTGKNPASSPNLIREPLSSKVRCD